MFLPNTETDKIRNTETETYFGRNIWPKPNQNDIRLSTRCYEYAELGKYADRLFGEELCAFISAANVKAIRIASLIFQ